MNISIYLMAICLFIAFNLNRKMGIYIIACISEQIDTAYEYKVVYA